MRASPVSWRMPNFEVLTEVLYNICGPLKGGSGGGANYSERNESIGLLIDVFKDCDPIDKRATIQTAKVCNANIHHSKDVRNANCSSQRDMKWYEMGNAKIPATKRRIMWRFDSRNKMFITDAAGRQ